MAIFVVRSFDVYSLTHDVRMRAYIFHQFLYNKEKSHAELMLLCFAYNLIVSKK